MSAGTRLPSIREMMSTYHVSQYTIDRALDKLEKEGLIHRRIGQGVFIADTDSRAGGRKARRIMVAAPEFVSPGIDLLLHHLHLRLLSSRHIPVFVRYDYRNRISRWIPREKHDGLILIPPAVSLKPEHLSWLGRLSVPIVILDHFLGDIDVDYVVTDNELGGTLAADHFIKLGHRKLGVLIGEPRIQVIEMRVRSFVRQAAMAGIRDVRVIDCQTRSGEDSCQKAHDEFRRFIEDARLDLTGLFVLGDVSAWGVLKACRDAGIHVPRDLSIVAFDNIHLFSAYSCPALTTVAQDYAQLAQEAMGILEKKLSGGQHRGVHQLVPPHLIVRESTTDRRETP
ncbi:MAG: substrate-binding domain-containing protein [Phycisphaerae bacterium]|nr:substrate-binding domain-containing protein [Phycisphaerae bacterium]